MSTRITQQELTARLASLRLSTEVAEALRLHLVEGVNASEAIRRCGISRAGFYRAKESIGHASVATVTKQVTYTVPVHRLEALNQRVSWQLDTWAKEDALAAKPVDPNNAAPQGNAGVTTGDQT